jgi:hypothetical protein
MERAGHPKVDGSFITGAIPGGDEDVSVPTGRIAFIRIPEIVRLFIMGVSQHLIVVG